MFFICSIQFSHSVVSNTLRPYELQHAKPLSITKSQSLLKLMSIESVMPSNHLILCHLLFLLPSIFLSISIFPMSQFFTSGGQSIAASALASVLPMNIQDWFPLGWASLVAQLVKNPPTTRETWVQSLSWEDRLEKGTATHSSFLAWRIPGTV